MGKYQGIGRLAAGVVIAASLLAAPVTRAQEVSDAQIDVARSAIASLGVTNIFDNILPNIAARLKAQLIEAYPNLEEQINTTVDKQAIALAARRGDLEKEAAIVYAKAFTQDELKQIATFFNSPAGKKLIKDQPIANRELGKAADIWASGIARDLEKSTNDALMKAAGKELKSQAPAEEPATEPAKEPAKP
ncbi:DUF2059 domain-containing protein [Allorhizobium terrae]|uniref:DUF2059 domain-containing protein n=1 Tax=Allorhizobium terrae TaxID=1848972 RepID=A0A4S4A6Y0_9HYPH|nr:DUF2059 domain-containing protein [Allorhizobium terrae]THF54134.1 DUF2059 domain-containing protein [Allorhizobium terrae]TWD57979.1 hypothetical protein FB480_101734 [Agrobacterium vitis]